MYFIVNLYTSNLSNQLGAMNIDKFGHHVHKRLRLSELFDFTDNALTKNKDGHFDLQSSRLKGLRAPQEINDAVNKEYVDIKSNDLREDVKFLLNEAIKDLHGVLNDFIKDVYTRSELDNIIKSLMKDEAAGGKRNP